MPLSNTIPFLFTSYYSFQDMENEKHTEEINEWVEIESPFSSNKAEWSNIDKPMVVRESFFNESTAFPPSNHENLPIIATQPPPSSSSSPSNDDVEGKKEDDEIKHEGARWRKMGFEVLRSKVYFVARTLRRRISKVSLWMFVSAPAGLGAVAVLLLLYVRLKKWKKQMELQSRHHLMLLINERDQKINQLLVQIARLNDVLLASRTVPVVRVHSVICA